MAGGLPFGNQHGAITCGLTFVYKIALLQTGVKLAGGENANALAKIIAALALRFDIL